MMPIGFRCTSAAWEGTSLPNVSSSAKYFSTVVGFKFTDRKFSGAGLRVELQSKPMWKPCDKPLMIKSANLGVLTGKAPTGSPAAV